MNYRHIYHAGNFADIIKHVTIIAILEQLKKKEKPFCVLDAFAGIGQYDLSSEEALKTGESNDGIKSLQKLSGFNFPELLKNFLNILNQSGGDNIYLGSPLIIKHSIRKQDRLIACELHTDDYNSLRQLFYRDYNNPTNVIISNSDAYLSIKSYLPFKEHRGLIFFDPPFEVNDEFSKLLEALRIISIRMANICTVTWYPIKNEREVRAFYQDYQDIGFRETLKIEFELLGSLKNMNKCGLLITNPPYVKEELEQNLIYLKKHVYSNQANFIIKKM